MVTNILYKYGDLYYFKDFDYEISKTREDDDYMYIDMNIIVEMTLSQHPSTSSFVTSMQDEAYNIQDEAIQEYVYSVIDAYIDEIESLYYQKPETSVFKYTAKIPKYEQTSKSSATSYELMYRVDINDDEVLTSPITKTEKINSDTSISKSKAKLTIAHISNSINSNSKTTKANITYYRLDARDYALDHATDTPEFSAANGQGSDCANFVSKCINAGGIPQDKTNNWYQSTDGTTATCGINWMRTGYYNNGGVVPYMLEQNYFYEESDESCVNAGSIMYWNSKSHVALVTYGDGDVIKYTQHSNTKLSSSNAKNIVYESEDATFYMPNSSSITVKS